MAGRAAVTASATEPAAPPFHRVRVAEAWDETEELRGVRLELGAIAPKHAHPGQVVKLRADHLEAGHKHGYFALANAPRPDGAGELLLKRGAALADAIIAAAAPGATLEATAPLGPGFPVEDARGRDVLLFAAGSGITPIRALLQWLLGQPRQGRIALYYGQRSDRDFAYVGEHQAWRAAGVHLVLCASQPSPAWTGERGYVQVVARALNLHEISTENAVAYLCGMRSMIDAVRGELKQFGLPAARTFLNV
jgi:NAD(P)H-flavin reductase